MDAPSRPGIRDLYHFMLRPQSDVSGRVQRALRDDPRVQRDFDSLLERNGAFAFPQAAAASSTQIEERTDVEGLARLRLLPSDSLPDEAYLLIDLDPSNGLEPKCLYVSGTDVGYIAIPLAPPENDTISMILSSSSDEARALWDPKAKVHLK